MEDTKFPESEELDALMRDFLAAELDPQLGRAAQHFRRHLHGSGSTAGAAPPGPLGPRRALSGWIVGIVGGAMAASIAALWARPVIWPSAPPRPTSSAQVLPVADYHFDLD